MRTDAEEQRDIDIMEKIQKLTLGRKLEWNQGEEGLTARYDEYDVVIRRQSAGRPYDILLIADEVDERGNRRRHGLSPNFAEEKNRKWYWKTLEEIDHMARRQYDKTDELVDKFLKK